MRALTRVGTGLLALTLVGGIAACGDDDDGATTDTTEASTDTTAAPAEGDNAAFCDGVVAFNSAVFQYDISEDSDEADIKAAGEDLAPLFQPIADNAPDDLATDAGALNDTIQALLEGDAAAFSADATFEQYTGLVSGAIDACDYEQISVKGVDYAYEGVPATIAAGTVAFEFENASEAEDHMMGIVRKKDGVTLTFAELLDLPDDQGEDQTEFLGEAFAPPGETGSALATLTPGSYAMICFIPVGSGEDGPPHFTQGMLQEFTVE
jgi:hypothetical protein